MWLVSKHWYPSSSTKRKTALHKKTKVESLQKLTSFFIELKADTTDEEEREEADTARVSAGDAGYLNSTPPTDSLADSLATNHESLLPCRSFDTTQGGTSACCWMERQQTSIPGKQHPRCQSSRSLHTMVLTREEKGHSSVARFGGKVQPVHGWRWIDRMDQNTAKYRVGVRSKKLWWPVFVFCVEAGIHNAWQIYQKTEQGTEDPLWLAGISEEHCQDILGQVCRQTQECRSTKERKADRQESPRCCSIWWIAPLVHPSTKTEPMHLLSQEHYQNVWEMLKCKLTWRTVLQRIPYTLRETHMKTEYTNWGSSDLNYE